MTISIKQWSDRKKKVSIPLIPSYIFIKVDEKNRTKILTDPSILNFVYWLGKPAIIRDYEIERLKGLISKEKMQEFEIKKLEIGREIAISKGHIKSKKAIVQTVSNNYVTAELKELGMTIILKTDLL